jgi:asparagine synthase (glutamine-hydrolysing)
MCGQIVHRGPDDFGCYVDGGCALGMRRLSIIDLAGGHQPIANEDGSVQVVFNGEIYNYRELRDVLAARGHRFVTNSDTEVLVHLYEDEGLEGIARLRGMFAYAIFDARARRLTLVRDRFGKKPLYYAIRPEGLYFASELKCLLAAPLSQAIPLDVDRDALRYYFQFGYIPDPLSPFLAIKKLSPASWLTFDENGQSRQGRYWRLPPPSAVAPADLTEADAREQLRELVDESVRIRMIADVPLGAFLSGGVDSSIVVSSMARQSPHPVRTFSVGFKESAYSELPFARQAAQLFGCDHREIVVEPDSVSLIEKLVHHFDEPFSDSSAIPTLVMSEFAARHVKVALSGDGGDELFGGYASFVAVAGLLRKLDKIPAPVRRLLRSTGDALPYSAYGKNFVRMVGAGDTLQRYFDFTYPAYAMRRELLKPDWMLPADSGFLMQSLSDCFIPGESDALAQAMYWEATANLTGDMLVKVDRMSMAASLEVRSPLLDHKLAEFAACLPHAWKIRDGAGKVILKDAFRDRFPAGFLDRKKAGFAVPIADWFRGPLVPLLEDCVNGRRFLDRGIVSPSFVRYLIDEHLRGRRDQSHQLWKLLILEMWFRGVEAREPVHASGAGFSLGAPSGSRA